MGDYVTASYSTLYEQASMTVSGYLQQARIEIDKVFGEGYADENPALVAAFIQAASTDCAAGTLAKTLGAGLREVASALNAVSTSIDQRPVR